MAIDLNVDLIDDKIIHVIRKFMIFDHLTPAEIKELLTENDTSQPSNKEKIAKLCHYVAGETIIREGEFDSWSFWLVSGTVNVIQNNEAIITFSQPGKIFGEMGVFEVPRTASVVCATAGVCLCIDMSILDQRDNSKVGDSIRAGMYRVIQSRFKMAKDKIEAEKKRLEMKYANILRIEKKIQKNRNF